MGMDTEIVEHLDSTLANTEFDQLSQTVQRAVEQARSKGGEPARRMSAFLNGDWLGHSLHATLTDFTIGTLLCAEILDVLSQRQGDAGYGRAATLLLKLGLLSVPATAAAGIADWQYVSGRGRRIGMLHALTNTTAATLFAGSLLARQGSENGPTSATAATLSSAGLAVLMAGAYLGGHQVFRLGIAVDRDAWTTPISSFTPIFDSTALAEGSATHVRAEGREIALFRQPGRVYAIDNTCPHMGCPLSEGTVAGGSVTCPCHGSRFRLADGALEEGPATAPVPAYDVREREGKIEVRSHSGEWLQPVQ
ncbi:MAG TPA: Rieske 2Fe-2S domain-containing protein [Thermomicrobiaceae bacterium]|nr:Rieske 2Fe-2S domain-containing protein [Thermomicrobiaceae bacterium]